MSYDERLFERMTDSLARKQGWTEKNLYGGRVCVVNGYPFIGALADGIIALCEPEVLKKHLVLRHCTQFEYRGKTQKDWVKVSLEALKTAKQLSRWADASFNLATSRKPPRKKKAKS